MLVDNFKKSITGVGRATNGLIPVPYNGDDGTGLDNSNAINAWRQYRSDYGYQSQCPFIPLINGGGYGNYFKVSYGYGLGLSGSSNTTYADATMTQSWFVDIGYGTTSESESDIKLEVSNWYDSNLLTHKYGAVKITPDSTTMIHVESVYENTGSSDVTVTEIGLVCKAPRCLAYACSGSYTDPKYCNFLVARKVLDTPITVHPGDAYKFKYELTI